MARRPFDAYFKNLAERRPQDFIRLAFPKAKVEVISTQLDKELIAVTTRIADQVLRVRTNGEHLLHFEYVSGYDPDIAHSIFRKAAMLDIKYNLEVTSILFQLKPPPWGKDVGLYYARIFGEPTNYFGCTVVEVWKWRDAILSGRKSLLSFVPLLLEISPQVDKKLLYRQRQLLAMVKDKKRRAELLYFSLAFATRYFSPKFLLNFYKEDIAMYDALERVPFFGEKFKEKFLEGKEIGWEEGIKEGIKEGIREGEKKGETKGEKRGLKTGVILALRKNILEVLTSRFGHNGRRVSVNGKLMRMINAIDEPRKLEVVFRRALKAKSLEEMADFLQKIKVSGKTRAAKA